VGGHLRRRRESARHAPAAISARPDAPSPPRGASAHPLPPCVEAGAVEPLAGAAVPLVAVPLVALPLVAVPLVAVPLVAVPLVAVPLVAVPLVAVPLLPPASCGVVKLQWSWLLHVAPAHLQPGGLIVGVHQPSVPGDACPAGVHVIPWFQLQMSVPQAVPWAVQSMSFVHAAARAGALHVSHAAATAATEKANTLNFMATISLLFGSAATCRGPAGLTAHSTTPASACAVQRP
jgi:hypothetical protein